MSDHEGGPAVAEQSTQDESEREQLRMLLSGPAVGMPQAADMGERETYQSRRLDQLEAYGQFVAKGPIYWPGTGTLVFNTGAQVPVEHVEKWDLELADLVQRVATPRLARAGRRFDAEHGGQVPGGDGVDPQEPALAPTATPPAPSGDEAAKADEGGSPGGRKATSKSRSAGDEK
jgi:hypothetical protein